MTKTTVGAVAKQDGKKVLKTLTGKGAKVKLTEQNWPKEKVAAAPTTPKHFLSEALRQAWFKFVQTQKGAHGYQHKDGRAVLVTKSAWVLVDAKGARVEGKTVEAFAKALRPDDVAVPAHVLSAVLQLRKLSNGLFRLNDLAGDANYTTRMQLLKKLRNTEKVLAKETGVNNLVKEFYAALGVPASTAASMAESFARRCNAVYKADLRTTQADKKTDAKQKQADLGKVPAHLRAVHDGKAILPKAKRVTNKQRTKQKEELQKELAIKARLAREELTNLAAPKPEAEVAVNLEDVTLLEDPANGIVLLCLEKANSQGAICVYNNGSRVAAGVLPTELLVKMRPLVSIDLVRDVNQLLKPLTAGVVVTNVAERHLTAVLDACKELIPMNTKSTETVVTKKFAAPAKAAKKSAAVKKVASEKAPKTASTPRVKFADDLKIKVLATAVNKEDKADKNPYREGTKARNSFELILKSKTFGEFAAAIAKTKKDVYDAAYILKWASQPHGKAPAYVALG